MNSIGFMRMIKSKGNPTDSAEGVVSPVNYIYVKACCPMKFIVHNNIHSQIYLALLLVTKAIPYPAIFYM